MNDFFNELDKNNTNNSNNIKKNTNKNTIASIIKALSWLIIIIGFIYGIVVFYVKEDILNMITIWLIYAGCSLGSFALSEIIQILHDIRNKLYSSKK